jgi:hypothetical protein
MLQPYTNSTQLLDPKTPQGQAYAWMNISDGNLDLCNYSTLLQRYAMITFYFSTGGPGWALSTDWLTPIHECSWTLVVCDSQKALTEIDMCK